MASKKRNASGKGGAHVGRAGRPKTTNQEVQRKSTTSRGSLESRSPDAEMQRTKVLVLLRRGAKTTIDLRIHGIMMPATRVFELKRAGYGIQTERVSLFDAYGFKHQKCARYCLITDLTLEVE
jgi:hypothetical protein